MQVRTFIDRVIVGDGDYYSRLVAADIFEREITPDEMTAFCKELEMLLAYKAMNHATGSLDMYVAQEQSQITDHKS